MRNLTPTPLLTGSPVPPESLAEAMAAVPYPRRPYDLRPDLAPLLLVGVLQRAVAACRNLVLHAEGKL